MSPINGIDLVVSLVGRWYPGDLAYVEHLEYTAKTDQQGAELTIVSIMQRRDLVRNGWPSESEPKFRVKMCFLGAQQFHVQEFGGSPTQIMGFDITDVSDRGWENIRFSIEDHEHDRIRLLCKGIDIISVEPV